jgi:hypothetical protein
MDTMGDAEEIDYDYAAPPREPLLSSEALAVTSLATAVASLFVSGVSQYVVFVVTNSFGLNNGDDQRKAVALSMAPVAILSFTAVAAGMTALKRRSEDRWVAALAVAGLTVGALIFLLAAAALLVAWTHDLGGSSG